jgi:hypothetical protein
LAAAFFFGAVFFVAFRVTAWPGGFLAAALSAARFSAHRLLVASEMARRPAALNRLLFLRGGGELDAAVDAPLLTKSATSHNAEMARSIASLCSSRSEMMRSTLFNDSPCVTYNMQLRCS